MSDCQLNLFDQPDPPLPSSDVFERPRINPAELADAALIAAIPCASVQAAVELAAEVGRRRLKAAIPALEHLCRRSKGFGINRSLRDQQAALQALVAIGGKEPAAAVMRLVSEAAVQGPGLAGAVSAVADLGAIVPSGLLQQWLRHQDPRVRANACRCRCARLDAAVQPLLLELLTDLHQVVKQAAACALGRLGRTEVRPFLLNLLGNAPSIEIIEAIAPIADEECAVQLARAAQVDPKLAPAVLTVLDDMEHPRATQIADRLRGDAGLCHCE
ncbi:MAG: HEAT repeat domain-containing protein [Acetobacteraceae bacterium]|nr:HEAT repeat domain-containing protein [Acetobacteraceae bacterium]